MSKQMITLDEAAERLGVTSQTIRKFIDRGDLPAFRIGSSNMIRINSDEVDQLLVPIGGDKR